LNSPLVDRSNVSTRSKLHLQPMTTRLSYLLNPFLLATALTNEISSSLYINQFGSISTSFWRYPLKSVRRKALGWISYFTPFPVLLGNTNMFVCKLPIRLLLKIGRVCDVFHASLTSDFFGWGYWDLSSFWYFQNRCFDTFWVRFFQM